MNNTDRPTLKMQQTAAAIRREARAGVSLPELAARFGLDYPILGRVLAARTIEGASVVLFKCKELTNETLDVR